MLLAGLMIRPMPSPLATVALLLLLGCGSIPAAELQTAAEVRQMTVEQAAHQQRVKIRGVVTFYDESLFSRFVQDETAGIYLRESLAMPRLFAGQLVEI